MQESKNDEFVSFVGTWHESGNHHSQQTDTRTENQTPHVLTHRWMLNIENTWTQGGEHHTLGSVAGARGGIVGVGEVGDR